MLDNLERSRHSASGDRIFLRWRFRVAWSATTFGTGSASLAASGVDLHDLRSGFLHHELEGKSILPINCRGASFLQSSLRGSTYDFVQHGSKNEEWCVPCQMEPPRGALKWFVNPESEAAGVVLSSPAEDGMVRVMLLDGKGTISRMHISNEVVFEEPFADQTNHERVNLVVRTLELAYPTGHLFAPTYPLEDRELTEAGPANCWKCRRLVSRDSGSLGCRKCNFYVCVCGYCLCGYPGGMNYLQKWIPPQPPPPCAPKLRREYVRIAGRVMKAAPGYSDIGYTPPQGGRLDSDMLAIIEKYRDNTEC